MSDILKQLLDYYYSDDCSNEKHPCDGVITYFRKLLESNNIVYKTDEEGNMIAFMEFWMLNMEQAQRIINGGRVRARDEDVTSGDICYIDDFWVAKEYRSKGNIKMFKELRCLAEKLHNRKAEAIMFKELKYGKRLKVFKGGK